MHIDTSLTGSVIFMSVTFCLLSLQELMPYNLFSVQQISKTLLE